MMSEPAPGDTRITTLIVDDEAVARDGLREMLAAIEWVRVVGEAASGPAALQAIETLRPELVFLDIQMPGLTGTELLERLTHQPLVVFTTAYAQHAVAAFELGALDYLLKPFGAARLVTAMERVRSALGEPAAAPVDRLREALSHGPLSRLFVRVGGSIVPVPVESVHWFESSGDYVVAHLESTWHLLHLPLRQLEARLDPARFLRIHRTRIVNLDRVKAFRRLGKGRLVAEMVSGTRLPVSRTRSQDLRGLGA